MLPKRLAVGVGAAVLILGSLLGVACDDDEDNGNGNGTEATEPLDQEEPTEPLDQGEETAPAE